jgi:hypothetical protein
MERDQLDKTSCLGSILHALIQVLLGKHCAELVSFFLNDTTRHVTIPILPVPILISIGSIGIGWYWYW